MTFFGELELAHRSWLGELVLAHHRPNYTLAAHRHDAPFVSLCLDGGYVEEAEGSTEEVRRGDLFVHPAHESHANEWSRCGATIVNLSAAAAVQQLFGAAPAHAQRLRLRCPDHVLARIERVLAARARPRPLDLLCAAEILLPLIQPDPNAALDPRLERARRAITAWPEQQWCLNALAQIAGLHRVHFAQRFKAQLGCPPGEYVRRTRLRAALRLMAEEQVSLTDAAHASGFFDSAHMTNSFRKALGVAPSRLRNH